ncbi:hypothetical protein MCOR27_002662 [Pyricularia oryzae]|uniref:F-box domain-containing protein n=2 Tax=Pyricularia TaxID=48558 RepID=A0ABQ8P0R4_PYRGI|nr:hypothetical protein MCOR02_000628 [Pyricularia oryzae]KAI6304328.1 hypothetical protein MCOR33_000638 [Pyricularia grisea]KAI6260016.1 hypothetical protein MCOR19_003633 [Pyricularia oryzae]KAI6280950.1 hypothetical protein MCOR26_003524 [Pyricularia oryzae]KAI6284675.1 hypothetical protein MCOR27_002662 [Pyricularia oryzae]
MKLTPIPKKKGARGNKTLQKGKRHGSFEVDESENRPSKLQKKLAARRSGINPDGFRGRRKTSLRDLPEWFLVDIFLTESNFSFPRCSGFIGRILSHPYVFRRLIAEAFAPTWDNWFGCAAEEVASYSMPVAHRMGVYDLERFGGDAKLQTSILEQKWLTTARLLQAQQVWLATGRRPQPVFYRVPSPFLQVRHRRKAPGIGREGFIKDEDFQVQSQFDLEFDKVVLAEYDDEEVQQPYPNMLEVHPETSIPDRLITGPWIEEDLRLLFWLGRAGATMSENQSWELVVEALDRMIALARLSRPGSPDHQDTRNTVSRIVSLFELFDIWAKLPAREWAALENTPNLGWLVDVLRAKTSRLPEKSI